MKRIYLMALVTNLIVISSCNNQAKQQEIEKQRQEDSMRVAENVKKELAEKEAKEKAEREKQEAEERAAREAAERESKTWTGASSESELRQKLEGTSWYINQEGLKRKLVFSDGAITMYTSLDGDFDNEGHYYNSYEIKSKEGYLFVFFGFDEEHMGDRDFGICFTDSKAIFTQFGKPIGQLTFMGR